MNYQYNIHEAERKVFIYDYYVTQVNDHDDKYDEIGTSNEGNIGEIYGDIYEDPDFNPVFQNPYYGGDIELESDGTRNSPNHKNGNEGQVITCTKNVYYEM